MLRFLLSLYEFRQRKPLNVYQVIHSPKWGDFYLSTYVEARSVYEACREFDTDPEFFESRRHGAPTLA